MARAGLSGERLALAGAELADEVGFDQVTVSAVARRFGVQVASLYSHVRNSDDLKTRIATVALTELADQAAAAVAGRAGRDALLALADVYRTYAQHHPGRYKASRHTPPTTPTASSIDGVVAGGSRGVASGQRRRVPSTSVLGTEYVAAGRRHSELMRAVLRAYDLDEPAQTDAVRMLGSVIHGYVTLELAGAFAYSAPGSAESWTRIVDSLDFLLHNWPERHPS
ncbi:MAG TPA: TetR/AcrR family transcriptional regulator [Kribbella sp.]